MPATVMVNGSLQFNVVSCQTVSNLQRPPAKQQQTVAQQWRFNHQSFFVFCCFVVSLSGPAQDMGPYSTDKHPDEMRKLEEHTGHTVGAGFS